MGNTRKASWGHWDISFWRDAGERYHGDPGTLVGSVAFPVGVRGPMDSLPGQKQRYLDMCAAWVERGELPAVYVPALPSTSPVEA